LDRVPDLVLLFTKAFHTHAALEGIRSSLSDKTCVLTLQNGIGHVEMIEAFVPRERIVHGITTYPCDLLGPAVVRARGEGIIKIGAVAAGRMDHARTIARVFERSGFQCEVSRDVETAIWEKLAFNAAMNALAAVLRMRVGQIGDSAEGRKVAFEIVAEVAEVAARKGIKMALHRVEDTLDMAFREHRDHAPSMLQDMLSAKPTEIDFINGAVVREARQAGLAVPVNRTLYRLVKILESQHL
jgi:2-dehydropantoate 2-reductase